MIATNLEALEGLVACPQCDALHRLRAIPVGSTARCSRCHAVLLAPRKGSIATIVSLALGSLILMVAAVTFPFLMIETSGLVSRASVIDAILAFSESSGLMVPLSVVTAALIVLLPAMRLLALLYSLSPLVVGRALLPQARLLFRVAMRLRPWAMAEIFLVGVAVAVIKIAGMATVEFGPAFWAFVGLVLLNTAKDTIICERSIWLELDRAKLS